MAPRFTSASFSEDEGREPSIKFNSSGEVDEAVVRAEGEDRTTLFVWGLVTAAATGGLLFGFDVRRLICPPLFLYRSQLTLVTARNQTGVIGGALVHRDVAADLGRVPLRNFQKEVSAIAPQLLNATCLLTFYSRSSRLLPLLALLSAASALDCLFVPHSTKLKSHSCSLRSFYRPTSAGASSSLVSLT